MRRFQKIVTLFWPFIKLSYNYIQCHTLHTLHTMLLLRNDCSKLQTHFQLTAFFFLPTTNIDALYYLKTYRDSLNRGKIILHLHKIN